MMTKRTRIYRVSVEFDSLVREFQREINGDLKRVNRRPIKKIEAVDIIGNYAREGKSRKRNNENIFTF